MPQVFVAVGSNVEPAMRMRQAAAALRRQFGAVHFSTCYRNPAFGFSGDDFFNCVAELTTSDDIDSLLKQFRRIEAECGRQPTDPKWAPRAMDLDLLLYGTVVGSGPGYTLPRRDLLQRVYMLGPLAQLAPNLTLPPNGPVLKTIWAAFPQAEHTLLATDLDLNAP